MSSCVLVRILESVVARHREGGRRLARGDLCELAVRETDRAAP